MKTLFCLSATILFLALFNSAAFGATNCSNGDQTLLTNIAYHNLVINNSQQVFLNSPETVENILRLQSGIFEISTNHLTIGNCGQIIHAGGTLNGTPILGNCGQVGIKAP